MSTAIFPITEQPNPLTTDMDLADPVGIVRLLRQVDGQLFGGWKTEPGLLDESTLTTCAKIALAAARVIRVGDGGAIMLSGAGTSGRFASFVTREFNRLLRLSHRPEMFHALLAGGEPSLVKAQEGAEDNPAVGVNELKSALQKFEDGELKSGLFIGISCGFSAAYVAGQLDALQTDTRFVPVLMGFNRIDQARSTPIEKWNKTFADVIREMGQNPRAIILNPIYGPEAVTGSTRMKGGSATKLLLESIFYTAFEIAGIGDGDSQSTELVETEDLALVSERIRQLICRGREALFAAYSQPEALAELVKMAGSALRSGGQVSYLGRETAGILAMIDASECPPTFGALADDVRGFIRSGWQELLDEKRDFSSKGPDYEIDHAAFEKRRLPELSKGDFVLGAAIGEVGPNTRRLLEESVKTRATVALLLVAALDPKAADLPAGLENFVCIQVPSLGVRPGFHSEAELCLKVCLNAISTGAHIHVGKVYYNQMIDLRLSNQKLYLRALDTIQALTGVTLEIARTSLLKAAFRKDQLSPQELDSPPSSIIKAAGERQKIVPTALLLASGVTNQKEAGRMLAEDPVVRRVLSGRLMSGRVSAASIPKLSQ